MTPPASRAGYAYLQGTLTSPPDSQAAYATIDRVRAKVHAVPGGRALVGGATAVNLDVARASTHDRDLIIPLILAVVLLNLDAFQLASDLFGQASLAGTLAEHATGLSKLADAEPRQGPLSKDDLGDFVQINAVLNVPDLKLGWQRSAFVERYCAMRQTCALPASLTATAPREDWGSFLMYGARWLLGLLVSALLLSLGAPFWADLLRDLLVRRGGTDRRAAQDEQPAASPR